MSKALFERLMGVNCRSREPKSNTRTELRDDVQGFFKGERYDNCTIGTRLIGGSDSVGSYE